jgi:mono/diheme cytochrome c family protein
VKSVFFAALALAHPLSAQTALPEGEGKKLVERICNECHGPENYVKKRLTKDGWEKVVQDMIEKGAQGTDAEFDIVVEYLSKHFGKPTAKKAF